MPAPYFPSGLGHIPPFSKCLPLSPIVLPVPSSAVLQLSLPPADSPFSAAYLLVRKFPPPVSYRRASPAVPALLRKERCVINTTTEPRSQSVDPIRSSSTNFNCGESPGLIWITSPATSPSQCCTSFFVKRRRPAQSVSGTPPNEGGSIPPVKALVGRVNQSCCWFLSTEGQITHLNGELPATRGVTGFHHRCGWPINVMSNRTAAVDGRQQSAQPAGQSGPHHDEDDGVGKLGTEAVPAASPACGDGPLRSVAELRSQLASLYHSYARLLRVAAVKLGESPASSAASSSMPTAVALSADCWREASRLRSSLRDPRRVRIQAKVQLCIDLEAALVAKRNALAEVDAVLLRLTTVP